MSALPVRYTNNHHVAPSKTASPIVVAVNKTGLAGCCVQSAYHRQQQQQHQRHHQTPPVKRHPTKMAAARRAKSRSRSRASSASGTSAGSPAKRRNGKAGGAAGAKKLPQLMTGPQSQQQQQEMTQQTEQQQQVAASLTAQQMVLDVVAATGSNGAPAATTTNAVGDAGRRTTTSVEWGTQVLVGEDVLRTPDAAACERLLAATEDLQQPGNVTDHETGLVVRSPQQQHNNNNSMNEMHLMDTSEAMEDEDSELPSTSAGCSGSVGGVDAESPAVVVAPRRSNEELFAELQEALALEPKYQPSLYLPQSSQVSQKRGLGKGVCRLSGTQDNVFE